MRVRDLVAGYGAEPVLKGVSIELAERDFVGVIGPNGSGKTTLLRSMSRVLPPRSGLVELDGRDIYSVPARDFARRVAVVPQDTLVAFDFTVMEIVLMGRSPRLGRFAVESAQRHVDRAGSARAGPAPSTSRTGPSTRSPAASGSG